MKTAHSGDWPLTGRSEELELVWNLVTGTPATSVVIGGDAGVGKSRLARSVLASAAAVGWATLEVRGSEGYGSVPLGPWRTVLHTAPAAGLAELSAGVMAALDELRTEIGLAVFVDDCHALDEASAGFLHQLVSAKAITAVVTVRSGTKVPASITSLWKDGLATRVELQNLSEQETAEVLSAGLGGSVRDSTARRMWHVTGGNPLYLREVVLASLENGALAQTDGEWRWQGAWATGSRLQEIVAGRLDRLDADELSAMETLAIAGSLSVDIVTGLASTAALQALRCQGAKFAFHYAGKAAKA